ncbi:TonB-dependent receptor domain-containing protein, partial [Escherichia coli]
LRGGVRYQAIDTRSTGSATSNTRAAPVTRTTASRALLPSLELRLTLAPDLLLRATASENINRPDVADLRAAAVVSVSPFGGTITAGNPELTPFRAQSFDFALERYGAGGGLIALGLFYKHMDSFITSAT